MPVAVQLDRTGHGGLRAGYRAHAELPCRVRGRPGIEANLYLHAGAGGQGGRQHARIRREYGRRSAQLRNLYRGRACVCNRHSLIEGCPHVHVSEVNHRRTNHQGRRACR